MKLNSYFFAVFFVSTFVAADILPFNYNGNPALASIMRKCTKDAIDEHIVNPGRCSLFQVMGVISRDAALKFKRRTGKSPAEANLEKHYCTHCKTIFDDCTQAQFHSC